MQIEMKAATGGIYIPTSFSVILDTDSQKCSSRRDLNRDIPLCNPDPRLAQFCHDSFYHWKGGVCVNVGCGSESGVVGGGESRSWRIHQEDNSAANRPVCGRVPVVHAEVLDGPNRERVVANRTVEAGVLARKAGGAGSVLGWEGGGRLKVEEGERLSPGEIAVGESGGKNASLDGIRFENSGLCVDARMKEPTQAGLRRRHATSIDSSRPKMERNLVVLGVLRRKLDGLHLPFINFFVVVIRLLPFIVAEVGGGLDQHLEDGKELDLLVEGFEVSRVCMWSSMVGWLEKGEIA